MHVCCIGTGAMMCETMRSDASQREGDAVSLKWNGDTERLLAPGNLGVVRSAMRTQADVLRAVREDRALVVVLLPLRQEPVDSLLELRPFLSDDELAMVARALGFWLSLHWP